MIRLLGKGGLALFFLIPLVLEKLTGLYFFGNTNERLLMSYAKHSSFIFAGITFIIQ
jgi:hypothetical protein